MDDSRSSTEGPICYEQLRVVIDMNDFVSWAEGFRCYKQLKYREKVESVPLLKNCPDEYLKRVESVWVPEIGRIRASTEKM